MKTHLLSGDQNDQNLCPPYTLRYSDEINRTSLPKIKLKEKKNDFEFRSRSILAINNILVIQRCVDWS